MKKRLARVLGTIVVLLLAASSLTAFTGEINSEARLAVVFRAYIEAINILIAEYGDSIYVDVIDFDKADGLPELFVYVSQEKAYILGFDTLDELFQTEIEHGFFPPFLSIDPDPQDSAGGWYSLAKDENGRYYLVYYGFSSAGRSYNYFTIHNGQWITGLTMLSGYNFDHPERPDDWERYYMVSGGFVSAEDWHNAPSRILNIVSNYGLPRHEKTVHDIIALLEAKISEQWREDDAVLRGYIRVKFNRKYVDIDPSPVIVSGRVLVPVRTISEMLGAVVDWDGDTGRVFIEHTDVSIVLIIDSDTAVVNGTDVELDVPATLKDGRTMVPLRFIAENLGVLVGFTDGVVIIQERINIADILGRDFDDIYRLFGEVELTGWMDELHEPTGWYFTYRTDTALRFTTTGICPSATTWDEIGELVPQWVKTVFIGYSPTPYSMPFEDYTDSERFHFHGIDNRITRAEVEARFGPRHTVYTGYAGGMGAVGPNYLFYWSDDYGAVVFDFDEYGYVAIIAIGRITNCLFLPIGVRTSAVNESDHYAATGITAELLTSGLWHGSQSVGSGYSQRYFFRPDGTFIFVNDEFSAPETLWYAGNWVISNDILTLEVTKKERAQGGNRVFNPPDYEIVGGERVFMELNPPKIIEYVMRGLTSFVFDYSNPDFLMTTVHFGDTQYFLFQNYEQPKIRCPICGDHYINEPLRQPTPPMNIHEIFATWQGPDADFPQEEHEANITEFVRDFENVHTVTYLQFETNWYGTIILWTDVPLRDFSFVSLDVAEHSWEDDAGLVFVTREVLLTIDELLPTDTVVLNVAFGHYLFPHGAVIFTDEQDIRWRMFILQDMRGGCFPHYHLGHPHKLTPDTDN